MASKRDEYKRFDSELQRVENEISRINEALKPLVEKLNRLKEQSIRLDMEYQGCLRELEELGYTGKVEFSDAEITLAEALHRALEEERETLYGRLNMGALTLYPPQMRDYRNLSDRINKLEEEKRAILNFIEAVEKEKREAFYSALEKLNQRFAETFQAITGGKGWVQLQNPEDPFSGGLDLIVEFPGKPPMPVTALSGGEKSVVSVCYIFALQSLTKASPFYIFDEVDAHLDPVNVDRLAELLARESKKTQIIVISFKEPMATRADRLFGIYAKNGVSHIYTIPSKVVEASKR